jgi:N-acetyl-anhydromuramyl-L-alanine amidase AmpD
MNPIAIVLHHSATPQTTSWQTISSWGHNGYADYHFGVNYKGEIFKGCPINQVAAHCGLDQGIDYSESGVYNQNSLAICAIGNFETEAMLGSQIDGIVKCIRNIRIQYPKVFLKLHKELVATACPGKNYPFKEILKRLEGVKITEIILNTQGSNRDYAIINGVKKQMPLHLVEVKGRNMIDLRFICEELGANITWDPNKKQIIIRRS